MDTKKAATKTEEEDTPPLKKTCISCSEDPDVTIVVGGQEFQEYRQSLRCWSSYFDAVFRSGMQEEKTHKVVFKDRDPTQWGWIVSLMAPMSKKKITEETLPIALDWFDYLGSKAGMDGCDDALLETLAYLDLAPLKIILGHLETVLKYDLPRSKEKCLKSLLSKLEKEANCFSKSAFKKLATLVKENGECRDHLFDALKNLLPTCITGAEAEVLLANDMLHEMIYLEKLETRASYDLDIFKIMWPLVPGSKEKCLKSLLSKFEKEANHFSKSDLQRVATLVKEDGECRDHLFDALKNLLPTCITGDEAEDLLANDMLHEMICFEKLETRASSDVDPFEIIGYLESVLKYDLPGSKEKCLKTLLSKFEKEANRFSKSDLQRVATLVEENGECRDHLFDALKKHRRRGRSSAGK